MSFYSYRIMQIYQPRQALNAQTGAVDVSGDTRFVPEFSSDGTNFRPVDVFPTQSLIEAQQRLAYIIANENTFREQVVTGNAGTLTKFYQYP
jgi:hypothetical protein